ncbi:fatty acyl-CoA hydrolase precursor, medium chain-like isoform 2-T2 [Geothlypis trichas]
MAGGPPVLLGLRDAAMAGPVPAGPLPAWATNKLGGTADWVPAVRAGPPRCARCGRALLLLVQVYCPLERSPAHRALHVFARAAPRCWGAARSWKVLRSQYSLAQDKQSGALSVAQKQESTFAAKDWCEDADDWGACDGAEAPACASLELLGLKEAVSSEVECASQLQQLHLAEPAQDTAPAASKDMDGSGAQDTPPAASEDMVMAMAASALVFQPFYINVVDEEDYMGFLDTDHADKLLKEYQQRESLDLEQMMSDRCLQDQVNGQIFSDMITNRKEKVPLQVSEDCLYLNVYTPVSAGEKEKLPVLVWIHGGGLVFGAASSYDGSAFAAFDNVVVVAIQYRLGIAGYFSTGDEHARGNWGFLDQVAALRWIQENIMHFGGDPGSVTIFGESAGGISVSALVLSPLAKGLFHKAISESGAAAHGLFTDQPMEDAQKIAAVSGCEKSSSAAMVECLRGKTEEELLQITLKMDMTALQICNDTSHENCHQDDFVISACADGVFFPKSPIELHSEKSVTAVPYIIGVNNHEFGYVLPMMMKYPPFVDGLDKDVARETLQTGLALIFKNLTSEVVDRVYKEYMGDAESPAQVRDGLLDALGDVYFVISAVEVARSHRDAGNPVYFYEFQHRPSSVEGLVPEFVKADHGAEIAFVFGKPFLAGGATKEENELSRTVMRYWTNFAKNGNPNGEGLVHWPQYDQELLLFRFSHSINKSLNLFFEAY